MKRPLLPILVLVLFCMLLYANYLGHPLGAATEKSICGNNKVEGDEECDGIDDFACPEMCNTNCHCPKPWSRALTELTRQTITFAEIKANDVQTINVDLPGVGFQALSVVFKENIKNVRFLIDANISNPTNVNPNAKVYQYFRIIIENKTQKDQIAFANIFFRVSNNWLVENGVRAITLQKQLEDKSWTSLGATKLYEDFDYNYFTSLTNSTSLFAITAYEPPVVAQAAICGNKILEPGETYENCCADAGCPQGLSCISGQCREVTICGNNICESRETVESCPIDCVGKLFSPDAVTILILAVIAIIAILVFFGKKIFGKPAHAKLKRAHVSFNLERLF